MNYERTSTQQTKILTAEERNQNTGPLFFAFVTFVV